MYIITTLFRASKRRYRIFLQWRRRVAQGTASLRSATHAPESSNPNMA